MGTFKLKEQLKNEEKHMEHTSKYITEYNMTGECTIDVDAVAKDWNRLWYVSQYDDRYTLIQKLRWDTPKNRIKCIISKEQMQQLIDKVGLTATPDRIFRLAKSWRRIKDVELEHQKRVKRLAKKETTKIKKANPEINVEDETFKRNVSLIVQLRLSSHT